MVLGKRVPGVLLGLGSAPKKERKMVHGIGELHSYFPMCVFLIDTG